MAGLKKAGANWVDGERFFDREAELAVLSERVHNGTHTLLTAQRRMGKTSLVRELLRRLKKEGRFRTVFVDLERARTAADAVVEIAVASRPEQHAWYRIKSGFANVLRELRGWIDTVAVTVLRVKLRAGVDAGNWQQKGDEVLAALADNDRPIVLALDELPILVNRMLKDDYRIRSRLKLVLGPESYREALALLTEAAICNGVLKRDAIDRIRDDFRDREKAEPIPIEDVLSVLEHDGYLEKQEDEYRFVSGWLEDWWRARHVPVGQRAARPGA